MNCKYNLDKESSGGEQIAFGDERVLPVWHWERVEYKGYLEEQSDEVDLEI